jgi:hypothetical protein
MQITQICTFMPADLLKITHANQRNLGPGTNLHCKSDLRSIFHNTSSYTCDHHYLHFLHTLFHLICCSDTWFFRGPFFSRPVVSGSCLLEPSERERAWPQVSACAPIEHQCPISELEGTSHGTCIGMKAQVRMCCLSRERSRKPIRDFS